MAKVHENVANARAVRTQLAVLRRVLVIVVWILAAAALLMQFTVVRTVGVSLLASAGVAGVVLGLAAQKSIGALLAGIQLSITQPIRIGDQVVVESENGTVEEISLTYVVVRIVGLPAPGGPGDPVPGEGLPELEQGRRGDARHR